MKTFILLILTITYLTQNNLNAQGCYFGSGALLAHNITNTSGNVHFDQINIREYNLLTDVFGVYPDFYYLYDTGAPNAYATPENFIGTNSDGTIMLGFNLIHSECGRSISRTCSSIPIILAHEFGHILDFKYGTGLTGKNKELFADFIAGSYLYYRANMIGRLNIQEVAYSFFEKGEYNFNHPNHHGTPHQRYACLNAGYTLAQQNAINGQHLSIQTLMFLAVQFTSQL